MCPLIIFSASILTEIFVNIKFSYKTDAMLIMLLHILGYIYICIYIHYIWSIALYGAETWTLRTVDKKHLESFEMWCCRRMEKISWTDYVRNEEVLLHVNEQRNILHAIIKRKANWIGYILRRNWLLK